MDARIRILIVDDHAVVRMALAQSLEMEPDFEVVGQAVDGQDAVEQLEGLAPDVVVMDISMPRMNGIQATRLIAASGSPAKIIGLSMHDNDSMARTMLSAGATAYVSKGAPLDELVSTVRVACQCRLEVRGPSAASFA